MLQTQQSVWTLNCANIYSLSGCNVLTEETVCFLFHSQTWEKTHTETQCLRWFFNLLVGSLSATPRSSTLPGLGVHVMTSGASLVIHALRSCALFLILVSLMYLYTYTVERQTLLEGPRRVALCQVVFLLFFLFLFYLFFYFYGSLFSYLYILCIQLYLSDGWASTK